LSIATASVSLVTSAAATGPKIVPISTIPSQVTHALASAYHTAALPKYTKMDLTIWGMTLKIIREEGGVKGLYRGLPATTCGVAPYVGINFAAYEFLRGIITPPGKGSVARRLSCGALAGRLLCWNH
jgi:solute carrier family 25 (mitochondrial phosphate transporter), member 23/24/25/41